MTKRVAAAMLSLPLFVLSGCSERSEFYSAANGTEKSLELQKGQETELKQTEFVNTKEEPETDGYAYVCGAVRNPGVYPITSGMRMYEIIISAGGFLETADEQWLNQAECVSDGQRIYVYTREETSQMEKPYEPNVSKEAVSDGKVNINSADQKELMTLPGIGEAKADAIIAYREQHGKFESIDEIQKVSGIKNSVFSNIKDMITV